MLDIPSTNPALAHPSPLPTTSGILNDVPTLMLWINNGCNARCVMCEIWRGDAKMYHSAEAIAAWAPEWKRLGVQLVELCGEPTIHPQLTQICEILRAHEFKLTFLSNGLRLEKFAELVTTCAQSLTVSLDGPPAVHDAVRNVKDAFGRLNKAVARVRQLSPAFPIFGRCVVHRKNYQHLCATVDTAHALNLTSISFFGLDSDSPAFGRDPLPPSAMDSVAMLRILPEDLPLLAAQLDRLERDYADDIARGFICEVVPLLRRTLSPLLEAYLYPKERRQNSYECNVPFKSAVLEPDGSVRPCWFLPSYGNAAKEGGVAAVLRKLSSVQFRAELDVHTHPVCQKCITPRVFDDHGKSRSGLKSTPIATST